MDARSRSFHKTGAEGSLAIYQKGRGVQYYQREAVTARRKYLRKDELPLVSLLAQKDYAIQFLKKAGKLRKELETLQLLGGERTASALYRPLADIYERLLPARRSLVHPYVLPDAAHIQTWLDAPYQKKTLL